jgi:hypothetical protein
MEITGFTLRLIILLVPGIISAIIIEQLTVHQTWSQFRFILYAFILGVTSYFLSQLFCFIEAGICLPFAKGCNAHIMTFWTALLDNKKEIELSEVLCTCGSAVLQSLIISLIIQKKFLFKLAKKLHISDKYGDENLFSYFLNAPEISWLYVRDPKNNLSYLGLRDSFSETDRIRELVLTNVKVYRYNDSKFLYEMPALYLSYEIGDMIIEMPPTEMNGGTK